MKYKMCVSNARHIYIYISYNISHNFNPLNITLVLILFIKHVHNMYIYTYLPCIIYINYTYYTKRLKHVYFSNRQGASQISHSVAPVSPIKVPVEAPPGHQAGPGPINGFPDP